jgi:hypothetical protein
MSTIISKHHEKALDSFWPIGHLYHFLIISSSRDTRHSTKVNSNIQIFKRLYTLPRSLDILKQPNVHRLSRTETENTLVATNGELPAFSKKVFSACVGFFVLGVRFHADTYRSCAPYLFNQTNQTTHTRVRKNSVTSSKRTVTRAIQGC